MQALAAAERWAETICKNSPMSIRASKQTIQKGLAVSLESTALPALVIVGGITHGPIGFGFPLVLHPHDPNTVMSCHMCPTTSE